MDYAHDMPPYIQDMADWLDDKKVHPCNGETAFAGFQVTMAAMRSVVQRGKVTLPAEMKPEVLAELPCFCGCMQNFGHESNLFCFRDEHGSGCSMCEDIALDARDMHKKGFSIDRIKEAIRSRYGRSSQ